MLGEYPDQLIVAEHHVSDTFANSYTNSRASFYGTQYIPHVIIDGENDYVGAGTCSGAASIYRGMIESRLAETGGVSPVAIDGGYIIDGTTMEVSAAFELVDPATLVNLRAHIIVLEDGLSYGGTTYDHITRAGVQTPISLVNQGDVEQVDVQIPLNPAWIPDNMQCVAFVQTTSGARDIYQAAMLPLDTSGIGDRLMAGETRWLSLGPNPVNLAGGPREGAVTLRLSISERSAQGPVRLDVLDLSGRLVQRLHEGPAAAGTMTLSWDGRAAGRTLTSGAYWVRLQTTEGTQQDRLVVIR